jgi:hypothetical protein
MLKQGKAAKARAVGAYPVYLQNFGGMLKEALLPLSLRNQLPGPPISCPPLTQVDKTYIK